MIHCDHATPRTVKVNNDEGETGYQYDKEVGHHRWAMTSYPSGIADHATGHRIRAEEQNKNGLGHMRLECSVTPPVGIHGFVKGLNVKTGGNWAWILSRCLSSKVPE